jgi:hypothetical protein
MPQAGEWSRLSLQPSDLRGRGFCFAGRGRNQADFSRTARSKGISLTTIDTLIAAIALEHKASVFTLDRDLSRIAQITGLGLYRF